MKKSMVVVLGALAALLITGCSITTPDVKVELKGDKLDVGLVDGPGESRPGDPTPGSIPVDIAVPGEAESFRLDLSLPMGNLTVDGAGRDRVTGQVGYVRTEPKVTSHLTGSRFTVEIPRESRSVNNNGSRVPATNLHLGTRLPAALDIISNLGSVDVDLRELNATRLKVHAYLGSITVKVPSGANVRLTEKISMGSHNLAEAGFTKSGSTWLSPGFRSENVLSVDLEANMGSITVVR